MNIKYSPELVKQLIKYIEAGINIKTACNAVGIHRDTFYEWLKDETKPDISDARGASKGQSSYKSCGCNTAGSTGKEELAGSTGMA